MSFMSIEPEVDDAMDAEAVEDMDMDISTVARLVGERIEEDR